MTTTFYVVRNLKRYENIRLFNRLHVAPCAGEKVWQYYSYAGDGTYDHWYSSIHRCRNSYVRIFGEWKWTFLGLPGEGAA